MGDPHPDPMHPRLPMLDIALLKAAAAPLIVEYCIWAIFTARHICMQARYAL